MTATKHVQLEQLNKRQFDRFCDFIYRTSGIRIPENKRTLLTAEGADPGHLEGLARRGIRYVGSDTTGIFCLPTCRHARRITATHRMEFRGRGDAEVAGLRPCSVCRP